MIDISIVLPCYNEDKNIPKIFERFSDLIGDRNDIEIIFVDNGSIDNTAIVLKNLLDQYKFARSIKVDFNRGYGYGILKGLMECRGKFIGWTHADLQTDPSDFLKFLEIFETFKDEKRIFVKGNRVNRDLKDVFFSNGMSLFETILFQVPMWEINAQPTMFSSNLLDSFIDPPNDFSFDLYTYYFATKKKYKIIRFDVKFGKRIHGKSKWNIDWTSKFKFIKRTVLYSLRLKYNMKNIN